MGGGNRRDRPDRSDEYQNREPDDFSIEEYQDRIGSAADESDVGADAKKYSAAQAEREPVSLTEVRGIGETKANALREAGFETIADIRAASRKELEAVTGIGSASATRLQDAVGTESTDDRAVSAAVQEAIDDTPFTGIPRVQTPAGQRAADAAAADTAAFYCSTMRRFAVNTKHEAIARTMTEHLEEGTCDLSQPPVFNPTAVTANDTPSLNLPPRAGTDDLNHEIGHIVTDTYGFARGEKGAEAEQEYRSRRGASEIDPFVRADPTESEYLLTQENGKHVADVPSEFETLIETTNDAFQRIHRHERRGGDPADLTAINNYSATSASELFAQMNELMQSDTPPDDDSFFIYQTAAVEAYIDVFEPSETVKQHISSLQADPLIDGPYQDDPFPDIGDG